MQVLHIYLHRTLKFFFVCKYLTLKCVDIKHWLQRVYIPSRKLSRLPTVCPKTHPQTRLRAILPTRRWTHRLQANPQAGPQMRTCLWE